MKNWLTKNHHPSLKYLKITHFHSSSKDSDGKEPAYNARGPSSIPESGRSPGEGHGNPHPYYCLENPMDGGAGLATVYKVTRVRHDRATSLFKSNVVDIEV